jgi:hypothetical protein
MGISSHRILATVAARQGEGDDRVAALGSYAFCVAGKAFFQFVGIEVKLAGRDLFGGGAMEAQFANSETAFRTDRGAEHAAGHGSRLVQVARTTYGVERWARFVVGELLEPFLVAIVVAEDAGGRVAGEFSSEAGDRGPGTLAHTVGAYRILLRQIGEASLQP